MHREDHLIVILTLSQFRNRDTFRQVQLTHVNRFTDLNTRDIDFDESMRFDAYNFLPKWLHPRQAAG